MTGPFFNLLDEPWIPVMMGNGKPREVGLRELFEREREIHRIDDANPLATAGLYRLALAILQRTMTPVSLKEWASGWTHGSHWTQRTGAMAETLPEYLERWRDRFWLVHPDAPWMQTADEVDDDKPIGKWVSGHNNEGDPVLFSHLEGSASIGLDKAARTLLAVLLYGAGEKGGGPKPDRKGETDPNGNFESGPARECHIHILEGSDLFETLHLNLLTSETLRQRGLPHNQDGAAWEQEPIVRQAQWTPHDVSDRYTRRTRRLKLLLNENGAVRGLAARWGEEFGKGARNSDPMLAFRSSADRSAFFPLKYEAERALWRDASALMAGRDDHGTQSPAAVRQLYELVGEGHLPESMRFSLRSLGSDGPLANEKTDQWRDERTPFLSGLLAHPERIYFVEEATKGAESRAKALKIFTDKLAEQYLKLSRGTTDPNAKKALRAELDTTDFYWERLGRTAPMLLDRMTSKEDGDGATWTEALRHVQEAARDAALHRLPLNAHRLHAEQLAMPRQRKENVK